VGDTLGLRILDKASGKYLYFLAACAKVTDDLVIHGSKAPQWCSLTARCGATTELIAAASAPKPEQGMGHISMSASTGAIRKPQRLDIAHKVFLHNNNSNPSCCRLRWSAKPPSRPAGTSLPDGMEITL
jgi:pyrroloquinoline quinone biosynthesis protein B